MSRKITASEAVAGMGDTKPPWDWIGAAFAAKGVILDEADFQPGKPLYEAFLCSAGMRHPVRCNQSAAKVERLLAHVEGLRSLLLEWTNEYEDDSAPDSGPRKARAHLGTIQRLKMYDADAGQWRHADGYAPGLRGFLSSLEGIERAARDALEVGQPGPSKGRHPNLHYAAFRDAILALFFEKTGMKGVKTNGEPEGPLVEIMQALEARLPSHMRPVGRNTGARLARRGR